MSTGSDQPLSRRRYVHLARALNADGEPAGIVLGLAPAAADSEIRSVRLKLEDWSALADQLDLAAAALRAHALSGGLS